MVLPNRNTALDKSIKLTLTPQKQKILDYIEEHGGISDREIEMLLGLKKTRAFTVAKQMRDEGLIQAVGRGNNKKYILL